MLAYNVRVVFGAFDRPTVRKTMVLRVSARSAAVAVGRAVAEYERRWRSIYGGAPVVSAEVCREMDEAGKDRAWPPRWLTEAREQERRLAGSLPAPSSVPRRPR